MATSTQRILRLQAVLFFFIMLTITGCLGLQDDTPHNSTNAEHGKNEREQTDIGTTVPAEDRVEPHLNNGKPVTLKVDLWLYTPTNNAAVTKENPEKRVAGQIIADRFMKLYPNVTIEWVRGMNKKDIADLANYYTSRFAAGDAPDIGMSWNMFTEDGWYLPLDAYLDQPNPFVSNNQSWKEQFPDYLWWQNWLSMPGEGRDVVSGIPISLQAGSATAIFYNKDIFAQEGIEVPTSYLEFIRVAEQLNDQGYIGIRPWSAQKQIYSWAFSFNLGPYYFEKNVAGKLKPDGNRGIGTAELMRSIKEGMLSPVHNAYAKELYRNFKLFFNVSPSDWTLSDFSRPWAEGKVAMMEDGVWILSTENANSERMFEFGMFPPIPLSETESSYVTAPRYTESGPHQPEPLVTLNIMRPSVERHGTEEAAVRFLQFLTAPENLSLLIEEDQTSIAAVTGVPVPALLEEWISRPFPITPSYTWPTGLDTESFDQWNQYTTAWINGKLADEVYFAAIDDIQSKAADRMIETNNIDTSGWKMLLQAEGR